LQDTTANNNTRTNDWHHRYLICSIARRRCSCHLTIISTRRTVDGSQGEGCGHITKRRVGGRRTDAANRYRGRPAQASASVGATHACDSTTCIGSDTGSEVSNGSYGRAQLSTQLRQKTKQRLSASAVRWRRAGRSRHD
jgi:hypothetical protein